MALRSSCSARPATTRSRPRSGVAVCSDHQGVAYDGSLFRRLSPSPFRAGRHRHGRGHGIGRRRRRGAPAAHGHRDRLGLRAPDERFRRMTVRCEGGTTSNALRLGRHDSYVGARNYAASRRWLRQPRLRRGQDVAEANAGATTWPSSTTRRAPTRTSPRRPTTPCSARTTRTCSCDSSRPRLCHRGGVDVAKFYDSAGADDYVARRPTPPCSRGVLQPAKYFEGVHAFATAGARTWRGFTTRWPMTTSWQRPPTPRCSTDLPPGVHQRVLQPGEVL